MYREQTVVALFIFGLTLASAVGFGVAWFNASRRARRLESQLLGAGVTPQPSTRAEQLEESIDSLAAQVDQLASGQEFLNRILADRLDKLSRGLPAPAPERELTPH